MTFKEYRLRTDQLQESHDVEIGRIHREHSRTMCAFGVFTVIAVVLFVALAIHFATPAAVAEEQSPSLKLMQQLYGEGRVHAAKIDYITNGGTWYRVILDTGAGVVGTDSLSLEEAASSTLHEAMRSGTAPVQAAPVTPSVKHEDNYGKNRDNFLD